MDPLVTTTINHNINHNNNSQSNNNNSTVNTENIGRVSVACQTEPNLIDKLIDNHVKSAKLDEVDLYQEYVRSAQCGQFWPLDKNPIRSLVPAMVKVDLPEQYLKNESLMFDLVQAITNNSKLVNLLAKYIHHIVPNVIISKRIDLIPLITCTIRVCRDATEQERLVSLLFNLIKRPNEEQRRMILSGMIVVLQVSPQHQSSSLLLPNLWDHVNDKFPERRVLLAESCATLAHYVRPAMRTNLILSILMQLLRDKNAAVRSAACKSFSCLLTLIMDRNDEVFDACLSATEDIIQDVLQQTPVHFCEHRYELEQMRFCALETVYPLLCMWAVKLNRFKLELAEFYLSKAERYFANLVNQGAGCSSTINGNSTLNDSTGSAINQQVSGGSPNKTAEATAAAAVARRRSVFFESRHLSSASSGVSSVNSSNSNSSSFFGSARRQSAFVTSSTSSSTSSSSPVVDATNNSAMLTSQRAIGAYLKMLNYLVPFVFSDAVHSCAWLSKSNLHLAVISELPSSTFEQESTATSVDGDNNNNSNNLSTSDAGHPEQQPTVVDTSASELTKTSHLDAVDDEGIAQSPEINNKQSAERKQKKEPFVSGPEMESFVQLFDRPLNFSNKLLEPTLIIDQSAIVAFHDQLEQEHMIESLDWILNTFLPKFLAMIAHFSHRKFYPAIGGTGDVMQEFLLSSISSTRQLCLLFGKHLTRTKIRPLIKQYINSNNKPSLFSVYIASLTSFEPIEQQEFEEIALSVRNNLAVPELGRSDVEILAISIKIIATNSDQIHSPSTRQKFLTYILDALVNYSTKIIHSTTTTSSSSLSGSGNQLTNHNQLHPHQVRAKLIMKATNKCNGSYQSQKSIDLQQQTQTKEFMLIIFRHILTCLISPPVRPADWAHILVTKFLPLLISLANDSADVYVCTYARLMCAQLVETFDTYLNSPKLTKETANAIMPALNSLKGLTEQIKASNLKRQIECLTQDLNERFFKDENNNNSSNMNDNNTNCGDVILNK